MPPDADIISLAGHARATLAAARSAGCDETGLAHLALVAGHDDVSPQSIDALPGKTADIQFPLRSIPKWVPAGD